MRALSSRNPLATTSSVAPRFANTAISAPRASPSNPRSGGKLEAAQQMANDESARTTGLYDRGQDQVSLDEVERILI